MVQKSRQLFAIMLLTVLVLSAVFTSVGITAYADSYTKTEKSIARSLAESVVNDLKRPSTFQIVRVEKGQMEISSRGLKRYVDSPYWRYVYRVKYRAKNSKGKYAYGWVYFTSDLKIWQPDEYKYYKAVDDDDVDPVSRNMQNHIKKLTSEYYKDL